MHPGLLVPSRRRQASTSTWQVVLTPQKSTFLWPKPHTSFPLGKVKHRQITARMGLKILTKTNRTIPTGRGSRFFAKFLAMKERIFAKPQWSRIRPQTLRGSMSGGMGWKNSRFCFSALKTGSDWIEENAFIYIYTYFAFACMFDETLQIRASSGVLLHLTPRNTWYKAFFLFIEVQTCFTTHGFATPNTKWPWQEQSLANPSKKVKHICK